MDLLKFINNALIIDIPFGTLITTIGVLIGIASLIYAYITNRHKENFEKLVQGKLAGIAGNIWYSKKYTKYSDQNFKLASRQYNLDDSETIQHRCQ